MKKQQLYRWSRKIHKWTGLLLGLQVVLWILSGLVMAAMPIEWVRGNHLADRGYQEPPTAKHTFAVDTLLSSVSGEVSSIDFRYVLGKPAYYVQTSEERSLFDAVTGTELEPVDEAAVRRFAKNVYRGAGEMTSLQLITEIPNEMRGHPGPLWLASFNDAVDTSLYLSPVDGRLVRVRSDIWRFYDFFWMLHIMDYSEREDTNNPLLISAAVTASVFTISGFILLFQVFRRKDFALGKAPQSKARQG